MLTYSGNRDQASHEREELECHGCLARYPIRHGVPILLPDEGIRGTGGRREPARPTAETAAVRGPPRVRRAANVLRNQGLGPFARKAWRGAQTELERRVPVFRRGPEFICPCCDAHVRFVSYRGRPLAQCPSCGAKERDRLLTLALSEVLAERGEPDPVLHVAPEAAVRRYLEARTPSYVATDLTRGLSSYSGRLDAAADLTSLPFGDEAFDLVVASHVLEHIVDDQAAIAEVYRVLRPGGVAILPVPIVHGGPTVEYGAPKLNEELHVRAPGLDYFERFERQGFEVRSRSSGDYGVTHQVRSYHRHRDDLDPQEEENEPLGPDPQKYLQWIPICRKPA